MPIPLQLECSPQQACHYSPVGRTQFGYINTLAINNNVLAPDIMVAEPLTDARSSELTTATAKEFSKPVVGILESISWENGRRSDNLEITLLASAQNSALLEMFFRQQKQMDSTSAEFALIVYRWDYQKDCYYVRFCTHKGTGSGGSAGRGFDGDARATGKSLEAILADGSVEEDPVKDDSLGAILFRIELTLCPPPHEQQFRIAASQDAKEFLSWGEAPTGKSKEVFE